MIIPNIPYYEPESLEGCVQGLWVFGGVGWGLRWVQGHVKCTASRLWGSSIGNPKPWTLNSKARILSPEPKPWTVNPNPSGIRALEYEDSRPISAVLESQLLQNCEHVFSSFHPRHKDPRAIILLEEGPDFVRWGYQNTLVRCHEVPCTTEPRARASRVSCWIWSKPSAKFQSILNTHMGPARPSSPSPDPWTPQK